MKAVFASIDDNGFEKVISLLLREDYKFAKYLLWKQSRKKPSLQMINK